MYAIGLMSGTSLDGVDAVLCEITGQGMTTNIQQIAFLTHPLPERIKEQIRMCCRREAGVDLVCSLNFALGEVFGEAVKKLCEKASFPLKDLAYIASHGQTIYHIPKADDQHVASTLQIGEPAVIAYVCGCQVISNFRVMDMAAGGEGAPLVPFSEYILYANKEKTIALQNIGGIGNVTVLPKGGSIDDVFAFDTGPGNMMIDEAMHRLFGTSYDANGATAAQGDIYLPLLEELMQHPYMKQSLPKTTGREMFGEPYVRSLLETYAQVDPYDIVATFTYFTAYAIAYHYQTYIMTKYKIDEVIIGGGGAHNLTLLHYLQDLLGDIPVVTQDEKGYSSDAKEAIAFVVLGNETLHQSFSNVPKATGAKRKVVLGTITPCPYPKEEF